MRKLYPQMHSGCPVAHSDPLGVMLPKPPFRVAAIEFDPPQHDFWHSIYREVLRRSTYTAFADSLDQHIRTLIGEFAARGRADRVAELTDPLPALSICELIGIHEPDRARKVRRIATDLFDATGDPAATAQALEDFVAFCLAPAESRAPDSGGRGSCHVRSAPVHREAEADVLDAAANESSFLGAES